MKTINKQIRKEEYAPKSQSRWPKLNQNLLTSSETKLLKCLNKKHILLPTKHKKPLVSGWNKYYSEKKTIQQLLTENQEYSLRTGTKIGNYYFMAVDLDDLWAQERIKDIRYIQTNKGIHRYLLIKELPKSCFLVNREGKKIGELHSKGRFVVGIGSIHEKGTRYTLKGRNNQKWSLKLENLKELQEFLSQRNIFSTPWGKSGKENIQNLEPFTPKPKKPSQKQVYYLKKTELEAEINNHPCKESLNICYLCLISFPLKQTKTHLQTKKHQKKWESWKSLKLKTLKPASLSQNY